MGVCAANGTANAKIIHHNLRAIESPYLFNVKVFRSLSLLPQSKRASWDVERCGACAHANLARIRRVGTHGAVALASSAPEHVAEHAGGRSRTGRWNGRNKVEPGLLIRAAEGSDAVWDGTVPHHPKASCQLRRSQGRNAAGSLHVLLPTGFQCANGSVLRGHHRIGVVEHR